MKRRVPSYFEEFSCIGGECEDTCCAGWYLPIDEATYKKYRKVKDPVMKKRLDKEIVAKKGNVSIDNVAKIKLKNNKCAFLNCEGLCDIYIKLGKNYMSESCSLYPRTFNKVNDIIECSLTMSCPEAARRILLNENGITFSEVETNEKQIHISAELNINTNKPKEIRDYLFEIRNLLIDILQDRTIPFKDRFQKMLISFGYIAEAAGSGNTKKISEYVKDIRTGEKTSQITKKVNNRYNLFNPSNDSYHQSLINILKKMREAKKWPSSDYEAMYENIIGEFTSEDKFKKDFKISYNIYEKVFLSKYEYILENYFVNYIFEREVPLDGDSLEQSINYLRVYYAVIELHLIGLSNYYKEELTIETIVRCLGLFTRVFDHNELYRKQLIDVLKR